MGNATTYDAYLEVGPDGACLAQVLDLPGCVARGATEAEALAQLGAAMPAYYQWLSRHDEYTPLVAGPFQVTPRERLPGTADICSSAAFFAPDAQPVSAEDLDWLLALLGWACDDLAGADAAISQHVTAALMRDLAPLDGVSATPLDGASGLPYTLATMQARLRAASADRLAAVEERDGARWSARWALRRGITHARWHAEERGGLA